MNDKIKTAIEDVLNTVIHATVAAAATYFPANWFTSWDDDQAALLATAAAGLVAGLHALGRILVNVKNAHFAINMVATSVDDDNGRILYFAQTVLSVAPQDSSAHAKALAYLESVIPDPDTVMDAAA